jgi:hypothetical protein
MFETTSFGDVDDCIRQVSEMLFEGIAADMSGKPWKLAFIDMRWKPGSSAGILKPRVVLPDGTITAALDVRDLRAEDVPSKLDILSKADFVLDEVWKSQDKKWYGIRLTFTPAGEPELQLDYDPKCGDDPTFLAD